MLTDEQTDIFGERLVPIFQELENAILADIARRVSKEKRWTETAEIQAEALRELGWSPYKIRIAVLKALRADSEFAAMLERNTLEEKAAVQAAIDAAKELLKEQAPELWEEVGNMAFNNDLSEWEKAGKTLSRGGAVDGLVSQMRRASSGELMNLTKALAFRSQSGTVIPARRAFAHAMNSALTQVVSGGKSYGQACTDAVRELATGGLRTADYASGRTWQIDTAVRNAVRTSVGQLTGEITQEHIESSGAPMVQVSQHWGARESHALWQGGIYTVQQFKTVCGYGEPSNPDNIYSYNCRHHHYPYWPGISEPIEYQPEPGPFEVGGRKYTYYQATQKQRAMERDIRAIKRDALAQDAMGDKSALAAAKIRLDEKLAAYKSFSAQINIREKLERTTVFGYDKGVAARGRGAVNGLIHETYGGYLGTFTVSDTVAKYREISNSGDMRLLDGFKRAVDKGDISVLAGIDLYRKTARDIERRLVGVTAANGTAITGYAPHFIDRVIGQASEPHPGMRTGVPVEDVLDTLLHSSDFGAVRTMADGDIRQVLFGSRCQVTMSIRDGRLIQTNPQ